MPKQHPFTKMKNVQIICFVTLLYPLELISVQYKKTTGILHWKIQPTIILYTNTYTNIDKSTPDDNVKNYERCHEFFEWRKNFNISHFESYYDVFFRSCEILQIKPVDVSMKKSGICFLYFIDLSCTSLTGMFILISNHQKLTRAITYDR